MQAAGMLRETGAICRLLLLLAPFVACAYSRPLQFLPEIPGYIPVYIRYGDQALEEINPALAEAFHETSNLFKNVRLEDNSDRESLDVPNSVVDTEETKPTRLKFQKTVEGNGLSNVVKYSVQNSIATVLPKMAEQKNSNNNNKKKELEKKVVTPIAKFEKKEQTPTLISKESTIKLIPIWKESPKREHEKSSSHRHSPQRQSSELERRRNDDDKLQDFVSVINVESLTNSPSLVRRHKDVMEYFSDKEKDNKRESALTENKESSIKVLHPQGILSNVQKISLPSSQSLETNGANATEDESNVKSKKSTTTTTTRVRMKSSTTELPRVHLYKDPSYLLDQPNASESSFNDTTSVVKLAPILLLKGALNETTKQTDKKKNETKIEEPSKNMAPLLIKDLSHLTDQRENDSTMNSSKEKVVEENDGESPMKIPVSFLDIPPNFKLPVPESQRDQNHKSNSSSVMTEQVGSMRSDVSERKDSIERT